VDAVRDAAAAARRFIKNRKSNVRSIPPREDALKKVKKPRRRPAREVQDLTEYLTERLSKSPNGPRHC